MSTVEKSDKGGILSLLSHARLEEQRRQNEERQRVAEEQKKVAQREVFNACEVAKILADQIGGTEQFFLGANPQDVETARNNETVKQMCDKFLGLVQSHLRDGSVEGSIDDFAIGAPKLHCVIPSRLTAMRSLSQLINPLIQDDDYEKRALTLQEIARLAIKINAVVVLPGRPKDNHRFFMVDRLYYSIGENLSEKEQTKFDELMNGILTAQRQADEEIRKSLKTLEQQVTVPTLWNAMEVGGIYLATIPNSRNDVGREYLGGRVLLCFDAIQKTVHIEGEYAQPVADGGESFQGTAEGIKPVAEVSFADVQELLKLKGNIGRRNGTLKQESYTLWCWLRTHIKWLCSYQEEKSAISLMRKRGETLTRQEFRDGKAGIFVLELEKFEFGDKMVSPAAICVEQLVFGNVKALSVIEASPGMKPFVSHFLKEEKGSGGKEKIYPETNLPKVLEQFIKSWKQSIR